MTRATSQAAVIEQLREQIRRREAALAAPGPSVLPSGFGPLDALLPGGGFPMGKVVEVVGARACGKTTLVLMALAQATRQGQLTAFVDPRGELYPIAAQALGADLSRLLVVRPPQPAQWARTACLLARSRAFAAVVTDVAPFTGTPLGPLSRRLLEAADRGRAALVLLSDTPSGVDATLRLSIERPSETRLELMVERSRLGPPGKRSRGELPSPDALPDSFSSSSAPPAPGAASAGRDAPLPPAASEARLSLVRER